MCIISYNIVVYELLRYHIDSHIFEVIYLLHLVDYENVKQNSLI